MALDCAIVCAEAPSGAGVSIRFREHGQFREDRGRDGNLDVSQDPPQLRIEVDVKLKRHQQRVRVEQDKPGHRFRASANPYLALEMTVAG